MFLGALVIAWLIMKAWGTARTEHELASRGIVPPRMQAKYGAEAAAAKAAKYGMFDYFRDAYRDYWGRRGDALAAARDAVPPPGETKVRMRDRLAAAGRALSGAARKVAATPLVRKLVEPVGRRLAEEPPEPAQPEPVLAVDSGNVDEGTRRVNTGSGEWEEMFDGQWRPVPKTPDTFPAAVPRRNVRADPSQQPSPAGGAMTAPTGEAVNYGTTVATLDAMITTLGSMIDRAQAGLTATQNATDCADGLEQERRPLYAAAISVKEHLEALSLDATTLSGVDSACEALNPNAVEELLGHLEAAEAQFTALIAVLEAALAGVQAARQHIVSTYGGAADVVEQTGVNANFLDSGAPRPPAGGQAPHQPNQLPDSMNASAAHAVEEANRRR